MIIKCAAEGCLNRDVEIEVPEGSQAYICFCGADITPQGYVPPAPVADPAPTVEDLQAQLAALAAQIEGMTE